MRLFDPLFYEKAHLLFLLFFVIYFFVFLQYKKSDVLINRKKGTRLIFFYAFIFVIVIGLRPISYIFADTINYANTYHNFSQIGERITTNRDSLFYLLMWGCSQVMSVQWFFLIIEILYVVPISIGCYRLLRENADIGLLFVMTAFSFFSYGVNGIRNGVALSLVFLAVTFLNKRVFDIIICAILSILAISFHASAALPVVCMVAAYFIKKPNLFFIFWGLSIIISIVAGNSVANMFVGFGFDDRLSDYIHPDIEEDIYTVTGFRWDFLLYSTAPILLGWYVIIKKRVFDSTYSLLLGTYVLANAFWIMVIRAEFSNRFAYLSWFLYPIVLAYPLLKLKIWPKTQGRKAAVILAAHYAFTFIMVFLLK